MKQNLFFVFLILLISLNSCKKAKDVNPIEEKSKMQRLYPIAGVFERDLKKDIMKNVLYSIGK